MPHAAPPPDETEAARLLFAQNCTFVGSAPTPETLPPSKLPEVAFIGRSNAGKSSLLNALVNRHDLAHTSATPGRTQMINFFNLGDRLMLTDLPGYGHAVAPRHEKDRWNDLVHYYLQKRNTLRCVCLLADGRHGILANDFSMMHFLDRAAISYQLVLTKIDLVKSTERDVRLQQTAATLGTHPAARPGAIATSARKATGIEELRNLLAGFAARKKA
jgi:GTP-binding protein